MNTQNSIIAVLLISAVVLGALVWVAYSPAPALAGTVSVERGDYIMTPGAMSDSLDLIYLISTPSRKMNIYFADNQRGTVEIVPNASIDLSKAF